MAFWLQLESRHRLQFLRIMETMNQLEVEAIRIPRCYIGGANSVGVNSLEVLLGRNFSGVSMENTFRKSIKYVSIEILSKSSSIGNQQFLQEVDQEFLQDFLMELLRKFHQEFHLGFPDCFRDL